MKNEKYNRLVRMLKQMRRVLVAYSGGADSTFLLKVAIDALGRENVLAVTAKSPTYQASELKDAKKNAKKLRARHLIITTRELDNLNFSSNPVDRCYYCKQELFRELKAIAKKENIPFVVDASNIDDLKDYRPGSKAKKELGVRSPLEEAEFSKADVRRLSKKLGLSTWNKPAMACLASRLPYGEKIETGKLKRIEAAEEFLHKLGFRQARVRRHGNIARIEVAAKDIPEIAISETRNKILIRLKSLGFLYITFDLEGYRTGSLNEALQHK